MRSALDEAIKRAAKHEFGLILASSHLSKLKPGLQSKSAVVTTSELYHVIQKDVWHWVLSVGMVGQSFILKPSPRLSGLRHPR